MFNNLKDTFQLSSRYYLCVTIFLLVLVLSGCGSLNKSSFRSMSTAYRELVEEYTNDSLLINVVRSSQDMPLSFLDIPSVTGSGSVSPGVSAGMTGISAQPNSLPSFFSTGPGSSYSIGAQLSVNNSFTFTQSSLDNATFMTSFLTPLAPGVFQNLSTTQVINQSVLYALVIESISIVDLNGKTTLRLINNPYSPNYKDFQLAFIRLVAARLNVEEEAKRTPLSPPLSIAEVKSNLMAITSATSKPDVVLNPILNNSGQTTAYQLEQITMIPRLCFGSSEPLQELQFSLPPSAFCSSASEKVEKMQASINQKKPVLNMNIEFRSPRDIFYFLGSIVNIQNDAIDPKVIGIVPSNKIRTGLTVSDLEKISEPLLIVKENPETDIDSLVSMDYLGNRYVIPKYNSGFSREVLTILAQIVTLAKVSGSIPASPGVLIQ